MVLDLCDGVGREVRVLKMCVEIVRKKIRFNSRYCARGNK
jgi:hypothetical protein